MAVDYFLKIEGIEGEAPDKAHKNEIDVLSWSWNETQMGTHGAGGGGGAGKVNIGDLQFTMQVNKASPKLLLACANGEHIKKATLTCRKAGKEQQEYLKIIFSDLLVSSFQTGGSQGDVVPVDSVSLNFSKIEYSYAPQDNKGGLGTPIPVHWDVKTNTGG